MLSQSKAPASPITAKLAGLLDAVDRGLDQLRVLCAGFRTPGIESDRPIELVEPPMPEPEPYEPTPEDWEVYRRWSEGLEDVQPEPTMPNRYTVESFQRIARIISSGGF
jgi:hypothetical protein